MCLDSFLTPTHQSHAGSKVESGEIPGIIQVQKGDEEVSQAEVSWAPFLWFTYPGFALPRGALSANACCRLPCGAPFSPWHTLFSSLLVSAAKSQATRKKATPKASPGTPKQVTAASDASPEVFCQVQSTAILGAASKEYASPEEIYSRHLGFLRL